MSPSWRIILEQLSESQQVHAQPSWGHFPVGIHGRAGSADQHLIVQPGLVAHDHCHAWTTGVHAGHKAIIQNLMEIPFSIPDHRHCDRWPLDPVF